MLKKILLLLCLFGMTVIGWADEDVAKRVIIVANSAEPESLELARYYAQKRGVPEQNILAFKMPKGEVVSWKEFVEQIFNPVQKTLVEQGWIQASPREGKDLAGRNRWAMTGHRISYMVVCRGVPLKIRNNPELSPRKETLPKAFHSNGSAVDSELSLLARSDTQLEGFVPNPLFGRDNPLSLELDKVVKASRLDSVNLEEAKALVDRAMLVEQRGLIGRSYIDIGGRHPNGDKWLEEIVKDLDEAGLDGDVDRGKGLFGVNSRFDMPALYFGWYSGGVQGPFRIPGFRFAPGAIALHIYSYSANSLRAQPGKEQWTQTFLANGATATFGNVGEPYLDFSHRPNLIMRALLRGKRLGDAAYYGINALSWQGIVVGDPLYQPFKVSFLDQWDARESLEKKERDYLLLRRMKMLARDGDRNTAIWIGQQEKAPSPAVVWTVAVLQKETGDLYGEKEALQKFSAYSQFSIEEAPIAIMVAKRLGELKELNASYDLWRVVMEKSSLPEIMRRGWLAGAKAAAFKAGDSSQAERWDEEIQKIKAEEEARKAAEAARKAAEKKS